MIREQYLNSILKDSATVAAWDFGPCTLDHGFRINFRKTEPKFKIRNQGESRASFDCCVLCIMHQRLHGDSEIAQYRRFQTRLCVP
jgi:hypothetical protein